MKIFDTKQIYLIVGLALLGWIQNPANAKPNVVLIFSDDMGYADGVDTTEMPIPNLQRLAQRGSASRTPT
jgi:hypothetical protein